MNALDRLKRSLEESNRNVFDPKKKPLTELMNSSLIATDKLGTSTSEFVTSANRLKGHIRNRQNPQSSKP